jgi:hypothetical protein
MRCEGGNIVPLAQATARRQAPENTAINQPSDTIQEGKYLLAKFRDFHLFKCNFSVKLRIKGLLQPRL